MYKVLNELTWVETKKFISEMDMAIIPVGSFEEHGPHLPMTVDYIISYEISKAVAEKADAKILLVPIIPVGVSDALINFPGTLTLRPETFINLLFDICRSLNKHGINKILIINGHGDNKPSLEILIRKVRDELNAKITVINYWELIPDITSQVIESDVWAHACEFETSLALYLFPEKVRKDEIKKHDIRRIPLPYVNFGEKNRVYFPANIDEFSEEGVIGDPTLATPEKGRILFEEAVKRIIHFIEEFKKY